MFGAELKFLCGLFLPQQLDKSPCYIKRFFQHNFFLKLQITSTKIRLKELWLGLFYTVDIGTYMEYLQLKMLKI